MRGEEICNTRKFKYKLLDKITQKYANSSMKSMSKNNNLPEESSGFQDQNQLLL